LKNHNLTKKAPKRKRGLRGLKDVSKQEVIMIDRMLPKKAR
jgi:ribosomal protein L35